MAETLPQKIRTNDVSMRANNYLSPSDLFVIDRQIHFTHPTFANLRADFIATDFCA